MINKLLSNKTITIVIISIVILVSLVSLFILFRNYLLYRESKGTTPPPNTNLAALPTVPPYTGIRLAYHLLEDQETVSYRFLLDPEQQSLAGIELAFVYNKGLLGAPQITGDDPRVAIPKQLQESWSINEVTGAYHLVTFLSENQQPFGELAWVTISFPKQGKFTARTVPEPLFIALDSNYLSSFRAVEDDWTNSFRARGIRTQGTVLYTSFSTSVELRSQVYEK